jgi:hypothetical protein
MVFGSACVSISFLFLSFLHRTEWTLGVQDTYSFASCGSLLAVACLSNREIRTLVYIRYIEVWAWFPLRLSVAVFVRFVEFEAGLWMV